MGSGDIPPMLDVEVTDGASNATIAAGIKAWCAYVHQATGKKPTIYSSPGFWNGHGLASAAASGDLVVAHWFVSSPSVPSGWSDWRFWQYNDNGHVPGIAGNVDSDHFHGTIADLLKYVGTPGSYTPPPPPPPSSNPKTYTVKSGDTMSGIAAKFGISLAALENANPQIKNPNLIYPGEVLNIP